MLPLKLESGGHRWQRIPPTERKGRVHTSTVTVAIIDPTFTAQAVEFNEREFKVEWYSGTGAGGQNRNKVQCCCRLTHLASGIIVTSQRRSRINSFDEAKTAILARLNSQQFSNYHLQIAHDRKAQVGSGMRGDKIRTYREQDDTVTDHRSEKRASLKSILQGKLEKVW